MTTRCISPLALSTGAAGAQGEHLKLPCPRAVIGHAIPVVVEAVVVPLALFYLVLMTAGFRWALLAALGWSYLALGRRIRRGGARLDDVVDRHGPVDHSHGGVVDHG